MEIDREMKPGLFNAFSFQLNIKGFNNPKTFCYPESQQLLKETGLTWQASPRLFWFIGIYPDDGLTRLWL